ncbi:EexN family lipoprotein [Cupriavidus nantongensis]|uniref:EexN family lipoprotein n=1 Tax=Cupriavidus nantongensis TaxID=1796606 RepID=UPI002246932A|nr:EexN family lipoprotein [Cupriavidus nantongensis]
MKKIIVPWLIPICVFACGDNTPVQTVDWYKAHDTDCKSLIAKCEANRGELSASANCINAKTAENHLRVDRRAYPTLNPINPLKGDR